MRGCQRAADLLSAPTRHDSADSVTAVGEAADTIEGTCPAEATMVMVAGTRSQAPFESISVQVPAGRGNSDLGRDRRGVRDGRLPIRWPLLCAVDIESLLTQCER
ncbi:hypothetical protein GCM10028775_46230 [Catellatospora paridis]